MALRLFCAAANTVGLRENNEDNFYLNGLYMDEEMRGAGGVFVTESRNRRQAFAVCDGMGGEARGEDASLTAVRTLAEWLAGGKARFTASMLCGFVRSASAAVRAITEERCGSTFVSLWVYGRFGRTANLGDSRAYLLRGDKIKRLTRDQSLVQRWIDSGEMAESERGKNPYRGVICQFLGMDEDEERMAPEISRWFRLRAGDKLLLCSDGLSDVVPDEEIASCLSECQSAEDAADQLLGRAMKNGGTDNVTCLCVFIQKPERGKQPKKAHNIPTGR